MLFPRSLAVETGGMETALFAMLVTASFYSYWCERPLHATILASLAALTRPEGGILLILVLLSIAFRSERQFIRCFLTASGLLLPWILFATFYFGSPIPNTIAAKQALYGHLVSASMWDNLVTLLGWRHPLGILSTLLALLGSMLLVTKSTGVRIVVMWMVLLIFGYAVFAKEIFPWYIVPVYPTFLLLITGSFMLIGLRVDWIRLHGKALMTVVSVAMITAILLKDYQVVMQAQASQQTLSSVHQSIGEYLCSHVQTGEIVAAEDIGYIGYFSQATILDRDGLVSPQVIPNNREQDYYGVISDFKPEWVVAGETSRISWFIKSRGFEGTYELRQRFASPDGIIYCVYRLRQK
jgi:Gpi18-like mannosyltransferase